jgi:hypothetical protein
MDRVELQTLRDELLNDCRVALEAFGKAQIRFKRNEEMGFEACAHQLSQMYNAIEQMGLRVAKAFENSVEDDKGWHGALLNRLSIRIAGVRPAFLPQDLKPPLSELKGFRHVFVHAYDLRLDPDKLSLLLKYAGQVAEQIVGLVEAFVCQVALEQEIEP